VGVDPKETSYTPGVSPAAPRKLATYDDLLALPEDVRAEVLDGEVIVSPSALTDHSRVQRSLGAFIGKPFDDDDGRGGPGGWWILTEVDVELGPHQVVRPDVSGWRRVRFPSPRGVRPVTVVPDWVCEVVSPSRPKQDRVRKRRIYAAHGVAHYWIVDPDARTLEALRLDAERGEWRETGAYDDESVARIAPFDAVELEVGRLFLPDKCASAEG
jgi:Uma2 family endonuclease